ncbi:hypothetical protein CEXT_302051 [Caerostris extrusa]|uniref:Uncharacterized protein n=1 Tax=Caerostris extrusa TaxID=172846 RepID=A0AAV4VGW8_CAEEX|nr:hypothetical protein CEXT_302051 [Caerostris extrusa]
MFLPALGPLWQIVANFKSVFFAKKDETSSVGILLWNLCQIKLNMPFGTIASLHHLVLLHLCIIWYYCIFASFDTSARDIFGRNSFMKCMSNNMSLGLLLLPHLILVHETSLVEILL